MIEKIKEYLEYRVTYLQERSDEEIYEAKEKYRACAEELSKVLTLIKEKELEDN